MQAKLHEKGTTTRLKELGAEYRNLTSAEMNHYKELGEFARRARMHGDAVPLLDRPTAEQRADARNDLQLAIPGGSSPSDLVLAVNEPMAYGTTLEELLKIDRDALQRAQRELERQAEKSESQVQQFVVSSSTANVSTLQRLFGDVQMLPTPLPSATMGEVICGV